LSNFEGEDVGSLRTTPLRTTRRRFRNEIRRNGIDDNPKKHLVAPLRPFPFTIGPCTLHARTISNSRTTPSRSQTHSRTRVSIVVTRPRRLYDRKRQNERKNDYVRRFVYIFILNAAIAALRRNRIFLLDARARRYNNTITYSASNRVSVRPSVGERVRIVRSR